MKDFVLILLHLAVMVAKLSGPGGVRAVIAENLLLNGALIQGHRRADQCDPWTTEPRTAPDGTGPSWLSFIGHSTDSLWSIDLFRCESIVLRSYWVLVIMDQFTRRLVGFGVQCGAVTGADVCRMCRCPTLSWSA
jgi:hypothetical protein